MAAEPVMSDEHQRRTSRILVVGLVGVAATATAVVMLRSPTQEPQVQQTVRAEIRSSSASQRTVTSAAPSTPGSHPTSTVTVSSGDVTEDLLMPRLQFSGLTGQAELNRLADSGAASLSEAPIDHALVAASDSEDQRRVFVLGDDLRWRRVDGPLQLCVRLDGSAAPPLTPRAISPDATRLAIPQPGKLLVVDVTSGQGRWYPVGGPNNVMVLWTDPAHVLVTQDEAGRGAVVDVDTGTVAASPYGPSTAFSRDGLTLEWGPDASVQAPHTVMRWSDGTRVATLLNNEGGIHRLPPLVSDDLVVGHHRPLVDGVVLRAGPIPDRGLVILDRRTGDPLLYQPTVRLPVDATVLLALRGDTVIFTAQRVPSEDLLVLSLQRHGRSVATFARFPGGTAFAWGRGWPEGG